MTRDGRARTSSGRRTAAGGGGLGPDEARQVRAQYGGKLTMIDAWFGRVLAALDRADRWDDTAVIVMTDHGHYLGEKDIWGKPAVPVYEPLGHIPLLIAWPGVEPGAAPALTTTVDLLATIADVFGVDAGHRTHGRSLMPLLDGSAAAVREWALGGGVGTGGARRRRRAASTPARRSATTPRWACGRTVGRRCPIARVP